MAAAGDDDATRKPKYIEGDVERSGRARRAKPPTPLEIEPEQTPPPCEPPDITAIEGFDTISPEIRESLLALHNSQRELDVGLHRLWDARNVPRDIERMGDAIGTLLQRTQRVDEFMRAVNHQAGQISRVYSWIESKNKTDERIARTLELLDQRLDSSDRDGAGMGSTLVAVGQRVEQGFAAMTKAIDATNTRMEGLLDRVRYLELGRAKTADLEAVKADLGPRVTSLEHTRTRARGAMWVLTGVMAAIAAAAGFLGHAIRDWIMGSGQK